LEKSLYYKHGAQVKVYIYKIIGTFITEYVHYWILETPTFSEVMCMNIK
jgi:hypothetical protein